MRTETIEIYQFDELSEEAKLKAIEQVRESYYEHNDFCEWATNDCCLFQPEELVNEDIIIENTRGNIYFSTDRNWFLDCAQAMEIVDEKRFLTWLGVPKSLQGEISYRIYTPSGRNTDTTIEFYLDDVDTEEWEEENKTELKGEKFEDWEQKFNDYIDTILRRIDNDIDYRFTDEAIIEDIQANEWEFYKNGTKY